MSEILHIWNANRAPLPGESEALYKAMKDDMQKAQEPKSAIIDPFNNMGGFLGVRSKPTAIPYTTLRRMATVPAVSAIINTRLNQVARYARRPRFDGDMGFRIRLKDREAKMTDAQKKRAMEIEEFFLKTGAVKNKVRKDNFNTFLRKTVYDSLTLDVLAFEKVASVKNEVAELWAVDGSTIELVLNNPTGELDYEVPVYIPETKGGVKAGGDNIAYVQKVNGRTVAEFTEDELAYAIRNPRTDLDMVDFGMSELETLIEIVTGIMNGVRYNTSYFSHSHLPQGVLEVVGKYQDKHLEGFKRHWKSLTTGAPGKWAVPVMALEEGQGFKFTPFKNSNRDMEFNEFLEFLFNIACAVYQIDPNEVGFKSWTSSNSMSASDNTEAKMEGSKDKGFIPLMNFLSDTFNSEVVDLIDDEYVFEWIGVDEEDEDKKLERQKTQLEAGVKTVAMLWKENDVDIEEIKKENGGELPKWANAPANAQLIQVFMADINAEQQENQQQQAQAQGDVEHERGKEGEEDAHKRQLEIMDKQHEHAMQQKGVDQLHDRNKLVNTHKQNLEVKKLDHGHQEKLAKMTAEQKAQKEKKDKIKKSIEDDFRSKGIEVTWDEY
jgi:hypothetical protein